MLVTPDCDCPPVKEAFEGTGTFHANVVPVGTAVINPEVTGV